MFSAAITLYPTVVTAQTAPSGRIEPNVRDLPPSRDATIVYDVPAREIKCWFDGPPPIILPNDACTVTGHHGWQNVPTYFYHGQTIHIIYQRAMLADKMVVNPTGTATPEPQIPIYGAGTTLPTLSGLIPVPTSISGAGVTAESQGVFAGKSYVASSAVTTLRPFDLYGVVDRLDGKSFATFLNNRLIGPASLANLQSLVAPDLRAHLKELAQIPSFVATAASRLLKKG